MRYSDDIIEEVRSKNDIVDVVSQYVSCLLYTSDAADEL